jgi:tetratricopeptide (TPR) repeat protein
MLRRGAVFSARQTCWKGLEELCQILDLHDPHGNHIESLRLALIAMREEEDFYRYSEIQSSKTDIISNLCWAHETPIVRNQLATAEAAAGLNPLIAAQHYRSYARQQLVQACDSHPWGSDLLYALGKTLEKQAWDDSSRSALIHQHAEIVFQAALETNPNQYLAATQLGHVLLKLDRPQEAREILLHSVKGLPTTAGYQNLAEACRRLNDTQGLQFSLANLKAIQTTQPTTAEIPFTEIDPQQFVKISPPDVTTTAAARDIGSVSTASGNSAPVVNGTRFNSQATPSPAATANGTGGWIPSLWR